MSYAEKINWTARISPGKRRRVVYGPVSQEDTIKKDAKHAVACQYLGLFHVTDDSVKVINHCSSGESLPLSQEFRSSTRSGSTGMYVSIVRKG